MMCHAKYGERTNQKKLLELTDETIDQGFIFFKPEHKGNDRSRQTSDKRSPFLSGWESGVDSQLTPAKISYTIKPVSKQRDQQQPSFLYKTNGGSGGIRSKPFVFVQSLSHDAYLRHYSSEHSYLANLYATGSQQPPLPQRNSPSFGGFPVRLSSPPPVLPPQPPLLSQAPPPPTQPQLAAPVRSDSNFSRVARIVQQQQQQQQQQPVDVNSVPSATIGKQVDLLTNGRSRPEATNDKRLEPLTLLTEHTFKFLADSGTESSNRRAPKLESGTPRLTHHSKQRVPTAERTRLRDFTSAHFGPALQQRLRLLTDNELAAAAAAAANGLSSTGIGLEVSGVSRSNSRLSEPPGGQQRPTVVTTGAEIQGLITAGQLIHGSSKPQRWFDTSSTSAAQPTSFNAASRFGDVRKK